MLVAAVWPVTGSVVVSVAAASVSPSVSAADSVETAVYFG